jgi:energy-coupling factor transporter ATP-binding protein EcfA2
MVYEDRKWWNIDFVGVLALDGEVSTGRNSVIINRNNNLQFYIRIVSSPPENFPRQVKDVCGFAEDLNNYGFYDDVTLPEIARKNALRDFLNRYILFFQVELRRPSATAEFHVASNIHIVKKSDSFRSDTILDPIPIFTEETTERNQELFEQQLYSRKYVGDNKNISKDDDDTPSMILWRDAQDEYFLYGPFTRHDYAAGGFRFYPASSIVRKINLQLEYIMESYLHDQVLFMDSKNCEELQTMLDEHGDEIGNVEGIEQFIKQTAKAVTSTLEIDNKTTSPKSSDEHSNANKEMEFMELFENESKRMGLYYDEKDLYNFHTAMKAGGLVILAGMSGTGKSKLVQCYANALKLNKAQLLFIPVRPFWQDDADVIGYLDTLHNVYRPGDSGLMNVLTRAANEYPGDLHIVCFDEMNLARVEHYFSQFLSVLELEENKRFLKLYNDEYSSRIYNQNVFPSNLRIGSNVIFVGTVNLDESTYHFSDKVLDRANVITLNIKPYHNVLKMEEERLHELPISSKMWENSITYDIYSSFRKVEREISLNPSESKFLWDLHKEFQNCSRNLGIGWRIIRQISHYLNNLPMNSPLSREEGFDLQLVQRVLTKLRGSEEQFSELLGRYNVDTKQVEQSKLIDLLSTMPNSYKFERTRKLIVEKSKELRLYGHTV